MARDLTHWRGPGKKRRRPLPPI